MRPLTKTGTRPVAFAVLLLITALFTAACSSGDSAEPTQQLPTAQEALDNARTAIASVSQFEFQLTHPTGATALAGGLSLRRAEGAVVAPERLAVTAEADLGRIFVKVSAVVIEGQTWMTNPLTGNWAEIAPEDSPFSFLDPVKLVTNVLDQTSTPTYPASGGLAGNRIVLEGSIPSEALQPLVGEVLPGQTLRARLTMDANTFLLTTAVLEGRLQADDGADYVREITFSGYEADLLIEPPI